MRDLNGRLKKKNTITSGTVAKKGGDRNEETLFDFVNLMSISRWV